MQIEPLFLLDIEEDQGTAEYRMVQDCAVQKVKDTMTNHEELLLAQTPEGAAFRENGLRYLEAALLAKEDWQSEQEREQTLAQFSEVVARLRALMFICSNGFFQQMAVKSVFIQSCERGQGLLLEEEEKK